MNAKWLYALFGLIVLGSVVFAISGAGTQFVQERGRWTGVTGGNRTTEGGNITGVNVTVQSLTDKWASFYGNVSGGLVLADVNAVNVYTWTWTPSSGGEVCLSTGSTPSWNTLFATTTATVDTQFGFAGTDADSANNTLKSSPCALVFNQGTVSSIFTTLLSGYQTCAIQDASPAVSKNNLQFCTKMNSTGKNYAGENANYEVMVPTNPGNATTTYFFFAELG